MNEFNPDWMCVCGDLTTLGVVHRKDGPCYIPNTKREWVGLTDEERYECLRGTDWQYDPESYAVVIESKLKEKNHG